MRVLVNGVSMLGRTTGIGWYARNLTTALLGRPGVDRVGVFDGRGVVEASDFLNRIDDASRIDRHERLKALSRRLPFRRQLVGALRGFRFRQSVRAADWSMYHEPNYVAHAFDGPLVATVCDCCWLRFPDFQPRDRLAWLESRLEATLRRSRAVITISEFSRREILQTWPWIEETKVFVTPMGIDPALREPPDREALECVRKARGLPPQFVLYVGTLEPRKNLQGLLEAYRSLPVELRQTHPLVLVGADGWNRWYFRDLLESLRAENAVIPLGYLPRSELSAVMAMAKVFCFPSVYEGFGMPPLEAAACGAPVVCGDIPALREVMGDAAVYVEPACPQDIASGLQYVLGDSRLQRRLSEQGRRRAALFTWDHCLQKTLDAYEHALELRPQRPTLRKAS